jgi:RND family efflux transporter MFP subunit
MKRLLPISGRALALAGTLLILFALLAYVVVTSGPLAPVPVTLATVAHDTLSPTLFGIGIVEARRTHRIGPTIAGRLLRIEVETGDSVSAGQVLGEMAPVDLENRTAAMEAAIARGEAGVRTVEAEIREVTARRTFARTQIERYEQLLEVGAVSREAVDAKRQEFDVAEAAGAGSRAALAASRQEVARLRAERDALLHQRDHLRLVAPVAGIVSRRLVDPGSTAVAGQAVIEIIEPGSVWLHVRFDQQRGAGLRDGLPARVVLHTRENEPIEGRVARVEPHADPVTEELLAKIEFDRVPEAAPSLGELAEVTVALDALPARPVVPRAAIQRYDGEIGVWTVEAGRLGWTPIRTGVSDLEGNVQILDGLSGGEQIVVYSHRPLTASTRIQVVDRIPGADRAPTTTR